MRADVHMDMVGGDFFKNKSVLHVTETPWSLPTFITDIGATFAETIRDAATIYTEDGSDEEAAVVENREGAPGTRNAFFVDETPYAEGSDHDDYDSSTIAVPSLYLRDWPDIYIHTDHDTSAADRSHEAPARRAAGRRVRLQLRVTAGVAIRAGAAVHFRACATAVGASIQPGAWLTRSESAARCAV